jgi:hypothetical protein
LDDTRKSMVAIDSSTIPVTSYLKLLINSFFVSLAMPSTQSKTPIVPIMMLVIVSVCTDYEN